MIKKTTSLKLTSAGLFLLLCLAMPHSGWAKPMGLNDCIGLACTIDGSVLLSGDQEKVDQSKMDTAKRRFFPQVDLDLLHQPKVDYFGRPIQDQDVYTSELKLTQPIYRSGALTGELDTAKQGFKLTKLMKDKAKLEAALEVTPLYFQTLAARETGRLRRGLVGKARELVELSRQALKLGKLRREDLLKAEARLYEALYEVAHSESDAQKSALKLKEAMGFPRDQVLDLKPQAPAFTPPGNQESLIQQALPKNPTLLAVKAEERFHSMGMDLEESKDGPRVSLVGRYGLEGDDFPGPDKYYGVMLMYEMSLGDSTAKAFYDFEHQYENEVARYEKERDLQRKGLRFSFLDGTSRETGIAEARVKRRRAHYDLRDSRLRLVTEIRTLFQDLKHNRALAQLASREQALDQERLATARAKIDIGAATPAEVLERELDLANSKARLIKARHEEARVRAMLCLLSGRKLVMEDKS